MDIERHLKKKNPVKCLVATEMVLETVMLKVFKTWTSYLHNTDTE